MLTLTANVEYQLLSENVKNHSYKSISFSVDSIFYPEQVIVYKGVGGMMSNYIINIFDEQVIPHSSQVIPHSC